MDISQTAGENPDDELIVERMSELFKITVSPSRFSIIVILNEISLTMPS